MAIIYPAHPLMRSPDWRPEDFTCFLCGEQARPPFVHWAGFGRAGIAHIVLHPNCAGQLGGYLTTDSYVREAANP